MMPLHQAVVLSHQHTYGAKMAQFSKSAGVTLVELMISVTISLILLAGLTYSYVGTRDAFRVQDSQARRFENGRIALEKITRDLRMAAKFGCTRTNAPDVMQSSQILLRAAFPIMESTAATFIAGGNVFTGQGSNGSGPVLDFFTELREANRSDLPDGGSLNPNQIIRSHRAGSGFTMPSGDYLPLANTDAIRLMKTAESGSHLLAEMTSLVQSPRLANRVAGIAPGSPDPRLFVISDCQRAEIVRARINGVSPSAPFGTFDHTNTAGGGAFNTVANMTKLYGTDAVVSKFDPAIYLVAQPAASSTVRNPVLVRYSLNEDGSDPSTNGAWQTQGEIVADGIDDLQIRFGISDDNRGVVNRWVTGATVLDSDWQRVMAVRVSFVALSKEENVGINGTTDKRLRQNFSSVVHLRNHPQE